MRNALEIRVIDLQECPRADLAIAAAATAVCRALYDGRWAPLEAQQGIDTEALVAMLLACIRDADRALIEDHRYLGLLGFPHPRCEARELWHHLLEACAADPLLGAEHRAVLDTILHAGPLARRILAALGDRFDRPRLHAVYRQLCDCLAQGRLFTGPGR